MASRLERLVSIDAYIRAGNYPSVQKLCEMFEVQPRTIYQDLRELREMFGLDIQFDRQRNGYYNAEPAKQLPPLAMTYEEALLITLAIEMLASTFGPSFRGALARAAEMVRESDDERFSWVRDVVSLEDKASCEVRCSVLVGILQAALKQRKATLIITEAEEPKKLLVLPKKVLYEDGHWHLVASPDGASANGDGDGDGHEDGGGQFVTRLCVVSDVQIAAEEKKQN
jgi:predicted DNA-binding transcriptional regulator YafY